MKDILKGVGIAVITPFTEQGKIDFPALGKVLNYQTDNGVDYFVINGTTAESVTLSKEEKKEILKFTIAHNEKNLPIILGIGGNNTYDLEQQLRYYPLDKVTAILTVSPYYNKPSQEGICQHYKYLADVSTKPILLYNVPARTGKNMETATVLKLSEHKNIIGIKEAAGDMIQAMDLAHHAPKDFLVISGEDAITFPLLCAGFDGVISVVGNAFPKDFTQMVHAVLRGEIEKARELHYKLLSAIHIMFEENNPAGVKAFMSEMGLIKNMTRLPIVPLSLPIYNKVKNYMKSYK
ncbi:MAG: 4-hydroxy-tetrahydrodipicolinate synthase [Chitinophagaceae bacterium]